MTTYPRRKWNRVANYVEKTPLGYNGLKRVLLLDVVSNYALETL